MLASVLFFNEGFANIVTITFTALIAIELLNVYTVVNKLNWKMIASSVATFIVYILSIALLRTYFDVTYLTVEFFGKVAAIIAIAWLPTHIMKLIIEKCDPPESKKVREAK